METTTEHYEFFKAAVRKEIERFHIYEWEIHLDHRALEDDDSAAVCSANYNGKVATITLNKDWGEADVTEDELRNTAMHEVLELLLAPMHILAKHSEFGSSQKDLLLTHEGHTLIHRLINCIGVAQG